MTSIKSARLKLSETMSPRATARPVVPGGPGTATGGRAGTVGCGPLPGAGGVAGVSWSVSSASLSVSWSARCWARTRLTGAPGIVRKVSSTAMPTFFRNIIAVMASPSSSTASLGILGRGVFPFGRAPSRLLRRLKLPVPKRPARPLHGAFVPLRPAGRLGLLAGLRHAHARRQPRPLRHRCGGRSASRRRRLLSRKEKIDRHFGPVGALGKNDAALANFRQSEALHRVPELQSLLARRRLRPRGRRRLGGNRTARARGCRPRLLHDRVSAAPQNRGAEKHHAFDPLQRLIVGLLDRVALFYRAPLRVEQVFFDDGPRARHLELRRLLVRGVGAGQGFGLSGYRQVPGAGLPELIGPGADHDYRDSQQQAEKRGTLENKSSKIAENSPNLLPVKYQVNT